MSLQVSYNRFSASDKYDELLFRASKGLQSAELNESQSILSDRITRSQTASFKMARSSTAALQLLTPQLARSLCCPVLCMYWAQSAKLRLLSSTFRQPAFAARRSPDHVNRHGAGRRDPSRSGPGHP